jgi:hypothetical protein
MSSSYCDHRAPVPASSAFTVLIGELAILLQRCVATGVKTGTAYSYGDQMKERDVGQAAGREIQSFGGKPEGKRPTGRPRRGGSQY